MAQGKLPTLGSQDIYGRGTDGAGIWIAACVISGPALSVVRLLLAAASWGISACNTWAITQTLAVTASIWQVDGAAKLLRQSGRGDRACGDGFGRGQDGKVFLGFHHHFGDRLGGLPVLDVIGGRPSTGSIGQLAVAAYTSLALGFLEGCELAQFGSSETFAVDDQELEVDSTMQSGL